MYTFVLVFHIHFKKKKIIRIEWSNWYKKKKNKNKESKKLKLKKKKKLKKNKKKIKNKKKKKGKAVFIIKALINIIYLNVFFFLKKYKLL